ncbi:MAG TPA: methyltransferase [Candidatus Corynebacterium faecigallinarum]|uniref:Methyltransferase n=1 Tax=Candidatus Corynebacterium faecigallinarum TaxID=2838528 RepID=A0A9D2QGR6_9CORY|nr:methyltransferase [Candidatus Corynebacterium faecigallinarum]
MEHSPTKFRWHSENGASAPAEIVEVDDSMTADKALGMLRRGTGLLWCGDFHNARQLMAAVDRRLSKAAGRSGRSGGRRRGKGTGRGDQGGRGGRGGAGRGNQSAGAVPDARTLFLNQRADRATRAATLGNILVALGPGWTLDLRRAPDVAEACGHAYGSWTGGDEPVVVSLTELQGVLGAWQWHLKGIEIEELGERLYPDYGVFSPVRNEYAGLVDRAAAARFGGADASGTAGTAASEPAGRVLEIGTGTGVLAAVLAKQGATHVTATDVNERAVDCARGNLERLGYGDRVDVVVADLWPDASRYDVVVFNPPWLPGVPSSDLEQGIYDADSDALRRFLAELPERLTEVGEGWLVLSDLAEHLGLRTREQLEGWFAESGLKVVGREDTAPRHPKARDENDPLHVARSAEVTSLWRLALEK